MLFNRYTFEVEFEDEAILPEFKGSTMRGAFGTALRSVVCALKANDCSQCLLQPKCLYVCLFESPNGSGNSSSPRDPHPFVIEPPTDSRTSHDKFERTSFGLLLFGWALDYLPYFIYAIREMGAVGLGKKINGRRGRFRLDSVADRSGQIYEENSGRLIMGNPVELALEDFAIGDLSADEISFEIETPLRIKFRNRLVDELPFHVLIRSALRRVSTLLECFDAAEPDLDYAGMVRRAEEISIERSTLRWKDWRRYSNRQKTSMLMGGLTGSVTYRGDLADFIPILRFCELVHLGKGSTFGLGKFRLSLK